MIIKVCGMRTPENIAEVARLGIDLMGFIFYRKSPRYVGDEPVGLDICRKTGVQRVGVFVNESTESIVETAQRHALDQLQLHGNESPEQCLELRNRGLRVIKALSLKSIDDLVSVKPYESAADTLLFDTPTPQFGGSGKPFDWALLHHYEGKTPFLLSGGIAPDSLEALRAFRHPSWIGIDLNSRFESAPGNKEIALLSAFIRSVRSF